MKKLLLMIAVLFTLKSNAQKAYEQIVYKGTWGNFNITLNYADGYNQATEIVSIHKKTGARKVYTMDKEDDNLIYLTNGKNKTTFSIKLLDEGNLMPQKMTATIYFNGTQEDFTVYKKQ